MEASTPPLSALDSAYSHELLDPSKRQIRLVRLNNFNNAVDQQTTSNATPSLDIVIFDLDTAPEYSALSYMWGDKHFTCPIFLNGHEYLVSPNLHAFLLWMLVHRFDSWIWIDQLSINQDLTTERNHQVSLMADVYTQASQVLVWLGSGPDGASNAFLNDHQAKKHADDCHWRSACSCMTRMEEETRRSSILMLIGNPYWVRLWVMQEVLLAKSVHFACDYGTVPFATLTFIPCSIIRTWETAPEFTRLCSAVDFFRVWVCIQDTPSPMTLEPLQLLEMASCKECQDPRDRVFAIQGILKPYQRVPYIDYSKSIADIFLDAMDVSFTSMRVQHGTEVWRQYFENVALQYFEIAACLILGSAVLPGLGSFFSYILSDQVFLGDLRESGLLNVVSALRALLRHYPMVYTDDIRRVIGDVDKKLVAKWDDPANELPICIDASMPNADASLFEPVVLTKQHWLESLLGRKQKLRS